MTNCFDSKQLQKPGLMNKIQKKDTTWDNNNEWWGVRFFCIPKKCLKIKVILDLIKNIRPHSMWIASEGQTSTHVSQSTHISLSTFAFSFSSAIANAGHSLTQVSHPVHLSLSTTATIPFTPRELLQKGRRQHRSGSLRISPCQPWLFRSLVRLLMRDIHPRRFRIRYIYSCQRLQPTLSLHRICYTKDKK